MTVGISPKRESWFNRVLDRVLADGMSGYELALFGKYRRQRNAGMDAACRSRDILVKAPAPTPPDAIASVFDGKNTAKRRECIMEVLETLVATGLARTGEHEGQRRYFLPR
jgi:hypothetical protein